MSRDSITLEVSTSSPDACRASAKAISNAIACGYAFRHSNPVTDCTPLLDAVRVYSGPSCYYIMKADDKPLFITLDKMMSY